MSLISDQHQQFSGPMDTPSAGPGNAVQKAGAEANNGLQQALLAKRAAGVTAGLAAIGGQASAPKPVAGSVAGGMPTAALSAPAAAAAPASSLSSATRSGAGEYVTFEFSVPRTVHGGLSALENDPKHTEATYDLTHFTNGQVKPGQKVMIENVEIYAGNVTSNARIGVMVDKLPGAVPEALPGGKVANYHHFELAPIGVQMQPRTIFSASQHALNDPKVTKEHFDRYASSNAQTAGQLMASLGQPNAKGQLEVYAGHEIAKALDKPNKSGTGTCASDLGLKYEQATSGGRAGQMYYLVGSEVAYAKANAIAGNVLQSDAFAKRRTTLDAVSFKLVPLGEHQSFHQPELAKESDDVRIREHSRALQTNIKGRMTVYVPPQ